MGFLDKSTPEAAFCGFCGRKLKGLKLFTIKTQSGRPVCTKCISKLHFDPILERLPEMTDEELDQYSARVQAAEERARQFRSEFTFPGFPFAVDSTHQWLKFTEFFYVFEIDDLEAIVSKLTLDGGELKGTLDFRTRDEYFPLHTVKVKAKMKGVFRSSQQKHVMETLDAISDALGELPILTPKDYRKYRSLLKEEEELSREIAWREAELLTLYEDQGELLFEEEASEGREM